MTTIIPSKSSASCESIKLGIDAHDKYYWVSCQVDGATPQPVQNVTYEELLLFVLKQQELTRNVATCYEGVRSGSNCAAEYSRHRAVVEGQSVGRDQGSGACVRRGDDLRPAPRIAGGRARLNTEGANQNSTSHRLTKSNYPPTSAHQSSFR